MKIVSWLPVIMSAVLVFAAWGSAKEAKETAKGEALFKQYCAVCHPEGGNTINPKKTLHKKDLDANRIRNKEDIVRLMRKPGPGMLPFDEKTIPDKNAKEIAEYILKTFK